MDDILFQVEKATALIEEIKPLLRMHYEEIARHRDKIALNPDYEKYAILDGLGMVHTVTARKGGVLIGYFNALVAPHAHSKDHLMALNDIIYILPEYRKGFTAARLFRFAEETLRERGVMSMHISVNLNHDFGLVLERLGFMETERIYEKMLI